MKVLCKKDTLIGEALREVTPLLTDKQEYPVDLGIEYAVMGLMISKDSKLPHYLVESYGRPFWCPSGLFTITDPTLPAHWCINTFDAKTTGRLCLIGFYELCMDQDFHDALMEREEWAMKIYFDRKNEQMNV